MANYFKIKHGFVSTGDGSITGTLDVSTGININGAAVATQAWVSGQGFATSGSVSGNYLALSGGTLTGELVLDYNNPALVFKGDDGIWYRLRVDESGNQLELGHTSNIGLKLSNSGGVTFPQLGAGFVKTNASGVVSIDTNTYLTSVPSEYLTQTEGDARYLRLTGGTLTGNINANGSILGDGNLFLRSYNNDPKGIFFRDGFEYGDTNQYNLSITIHDDGDGASDGMMISAYDGVFFNVQSGATPNTKFRILNNEVKAFANLISTANVYASGGNSTEWNTAYSWGDHSAAGYADSSHNHDSRYLVKGGSWNGVNMPGSRWGGFSVNGGEVVFQQDNPNNNQMSVMADGNFYAGERNGFWSLYSSSPSHNDYNAKVGFYSNASGHFLISTSAVYAGGNQVWHAGNLTNNSSNWNTAYSWGNHASAGYATASHNHDSRYYTESEIDTKLAAKADTSHKYHRFNNGDEYYDSYGQDNYLRMFTETATFDTFRFRSYSNVEYWDGSTWQAWGANLDTWFDGREDTGFNLDHTHSHFRFEINRSSGWPTMALFVIQSSWSDTNSHICEVTLETWDGVSWVIKDQWGYSNFQRGINLHATNQTHDGISSMRVTLNMDWGDANHDYYPMRRILFLSNFSGGETLDPWSWNYNKVVNFDALPQAAGANLATQSWVSSQGYVSSLSGYATESYVNTAVSNLVDSAPGALNTLNELAAALGDDPNFAGTITTNLASKVSWEYNDASIDVNDVNKNRGVFSISGTNTTTPNRPQNYNTVYTFGGGSNNTLQLGTGSDYNDAGLWVRQYNHNASSPQGVGWQNWATVWTSNDFSNNSSNWDAAFSWGNHASAGYLTSVPSEYLTQTEGDARYYTESEVNTLIAQHTGWQTGSDFLNGTLVRTSIDASQQNGDSFVLRVVGKSYSTTHSPFDMILQGYIYNNTFINYSAIVNSTDALGNIRILELDGQLCFWWARFGYWNSFEIYVTSVSGGDTTPQNRVIAVEDVAEPASTLGKKVTVTPYESWTTKEFGQSSVNNWNTAYGWGNHAGLYDSAGSASTAQANAIAHTDDRIDNEVIPMFAGYQPSGNYFTDGDTVLNMANNDGLVFNDTNNLMHVKADGINYPIIDSRGGSINGTLSITGGNHIAMSNGNITGVNQIEINDPGEGIIWTAGSSGNITLAVTDDASDNILNLSGTGASLAVNGATVATQAWVNAQGFTTSTGSNYYLSGASFSTSTGVLTLTVTGASNVTVDLDGRFALGSDLNAVNDRIDNEVLPNIPTNNNQLTNGAGYITGYTETDTLASVTGRGNTTTNAITVGPLTASAAYFGSTGSSPRIRIYTEDETATLGDTFGDATSDKSYIYFDQGTSSNDPGYIMHETSNVETNEGILHLVPSDDNSYDDYVSIHGTNDPDCVKIHTNGMIETSSSYQLVLRSGNGYIRVDDGLSVAAQINTDSHGDSSQWNTAYGWGDHAAAGYQPAGTYNTIIGTDSDINTSGATIIDNIYVTDGVITSMGTRVLTQADLGIPTNVSGNWWNGGYAAVGTDGVMEVGKYIDFHDTDTQTSDYSYRITNTGGRLYFSGDIEIDGGDIFIADGNTRLHEGNGNALRVTTNSGYIEMGPMNTGHCHIQTDRSNFYFNTQIQVDTGKVSSYNEDLYLQRAGSTKITVGSSLVTFANHISVPQPAPPTFGAANIVGETIEVVFDQSPTSGVDSYQVWSSVAGGSYGLIANIPTQDIAATMTAIDAAFSVSGAHAYRVYAIKNGIYSDPAEGGVTFNASSLDVVNMSVVNLNSAYYIQYDMPSSRFVDHVEIYMDAEVNSANLTRTGATLIYSGNNTSYMYQIGASDLEKFHQFWVEVVES